MRCRVLSIAQMEWWDSPKPKRSSSAPRALRYMNAVALVQGGILPALPQRPVWSQEAPTNRTIRACR